MEESRWRGTNTSAYDAQWARLAASGKNPHGEADVVMQFEPASVLDAGCGTGRVAIELAARGCRTVGVDLDAGMITAAESKAPQLDWHQADLATCRLGETFDVVVMAGNVMIFVAPGSEGAVVANLARHLRPDGGVLIAGFQLGRGLSVADYDGHAATAGLTRVAHWSTWDGAAPADSSDYAVLIHRHP